MLSSLKESILVLAAVALVVLVISLAANLAPVEVLADASLSPPSGPPAIARAAATSTPTPTADGGWTRIQAAGKMVVGTSGDYAPFESYDSDFELDGFDIALMDAIAEKLGVKVEYKDFVFDGLIDAVRLNQVDAAIAALSVTPERQAVVDFSNVYYVGQDGILAREDSIISSIEAASDVATRKLGVERGSVYESWAQANLVDTGLLPVNRLFSYQKAGDAVRDLKENRVDLVMLDLLPAEMFVEEGGVKVVGQGLNQQRLAIALPKGSGALQSEINSALTELQNEGSLADLTKQYLHAEPGPPTPTPTPPAKATATPTPIPTPEACVDGMAWVADLSYDDKNMAAPPVLKPGQGFVKSWRVRNSGTCAWDSSYRLEYARGNVPAARMQGQPVSIVGTVPAGGTYDLKVNLIAPQKPGTYQGFWNMVNGKGQAFGQRIWAGIKVPAPPRPTPIPTQPPAPGISFSVDRTQIRAGQCVNFRWDVDNVKAVYFYPQGSSWQQNGVTGHESRQVCPGATTVFELRVVKPDNSVETRQIRIDVQGGGGGVPRIEVFSVDPLRITLGRCVAIQWQVGGDVNKVDILRHDRVIWDNAPLSGSLQDCPKKTGGKRYNIKAYGPGGQAYDERNVTVVDQGPR